jgi:hypothetical protein
MFAKLRLRQSRAGRDIVMAVARCALVAAALAAGGCASNHERREQARAAHQAYAMRTAAAQQELEDDGLPAQVPPPANRRREPDDPREPYSPNYGASAPSSVSADRRASMPAQTRVADHQRTATY